MTIQEFDPCSLKHLLPIYYRRLFPTYVYCRWLTYGEQPALCKLFTHREFSFTLANDVYVRYQSFGNHLEFEKELINKCPYKIDIGAVYNVKPKDHNSVRTDFFKPIEKELVIDIDLSDYDDVRFCCSGASVCDRCWPLIKIAVQVIDVALREDFGFKHLLWVFSGRRGVHCWICDLDARVLSNQQRAAIIDYLTLTKATSDGLSQRILLKHPIHPSIRRSIEIIEPMFRQYALINQDFFGSDERLSRFLQRMIPCEARCELESEMRSCGTSSIARWQALEEFCESRGRYRFLSYELILQIAYPRMDANVSKSINHLLKSPFCIHPKTGIVSVPLIEEDMKENDYYPPSDAPTIAQLVDDLDKIEEIDGVEGEIMNVKDYKRTRLAEYVHFFDRFVHSLSNERNEQQQQIANVFGVVGEELF